MSLEFKQVDPHPVLVDVSKSANERMNGKQCVSTVIRVLFHEQSDLGPHCLGV